MVCSKSIFTCSDRRANADSSDEELDVLSPSVARADVESGKCSNSRMDGPVNGAVAGVDSPSRTTVSPSVRARQCPGARKMLSVGAGAALARSTRVSSASGADSVTTGATAPSSALWHPARKPRWYPQW